MRLSSFADDALPFVIAAFLAAAAFSFLATPLVRRIAVHVDAVDQPDDRRVNVIPMPRGGGVAVAGAFIGIGLIFTVVNVRLDLLPMPAAVRLDNIVALFLGGGLAAAFGVLDDYFDLRARWQFLGQLGLALLAIALGIVVERINDPFGTGILRLDGAFGIGFTVLWIAGMINSINFIDGLDGLSSGVALI
ncbi:MAG TPA: hypothetical protein VF231_06175, partial [Candidatus Limnocylindrales bacterium]